jgi:hypothetical protein
VVGGTGACWGDLPQRAKRGRRLDVNIVASVRLASTGARPGVHSNFGLALRADAIGVARAPLAPDRGRGFQSRRSRSFHGNHGAPPASLVLAFPAEVGAPNTRLAPLDKDGRECKSRSEMDPGS